MQIYSSKSLSSPKESHRHQSSILEEYKRLNLDEETFYYSTDPILYTPLPTFMPITLKKEFTHCIYLQNCTFYQIFTFALFENLIKGGSSIKFDLINKLKNLICSNKFLNFASYTKGLILKGIKLMVQNKFSGKPVAQVILGSQKLLAFSECWKQMIFYFSDKKKLKSGDEINTSMIQIFTNFFQVSINFYSKKGKQIQLQTVNCKSKSFSNQFISIYFLSHLLEEQQSNIKQSSFSEISSISCNFNYYILLNDSLILKKDQPFSVNESVISEKPRNILKKMRKRQTIKMDFPELFSIDQQKSQVIHHPQQDSDIASIIMSKKKAIAKGQALIAQMKKFVAKKCKNQFQQFE